MGTCCSGESYENSDIKVQDETNQDSRKVQNLSVNTHIASLPDEVGTSNNQINSISGSNDSSAFAFGSADEIEKSSQNINSNLDNEKEINIQNTDDDRNELYQHPFLILEGNTLLLEINYRKIFTPKTKLSALELATQTFVEDVNFTRNEDENTISHHKRSSI